MTALAHMPRFNGVIDISERAPVPIYLAARLSAFQMCERSVIGLQT